MHHIIYTSWATQEMFHDDLVTLLKQAREFNALAGITGALLYGNGRFMQIIEGEQSVLADLYARIGQDARHREVVTVTDKAIDQRTFLTWSMAFQVVDPEQFHDLTGYVSPDWLEHLLFAANPADTMLLEHVREIISDAELQRPHISD